MLMLQNIKAWRAVRGECGTHRHRCATLTAHDTVGVRSAGPVSSTTPATPAQWMVASRPSLRLLAAAI